MSRRNLHPGFSLVRMLQAWQGEYCDWSKRDLTGKRYVYVWADGNYWLPVDR